LTKQIDKETMSLIPLLIWNSIYNSGNYKVSRMISLLARIGLLCHTFPSLICSSFALQNGFIVTTQLED